MNATSCESKPDAWKDNRPAKGRCLAALQHGRQGGRWIVLVSHLQKPGGWDFQFENENDIRTSTTRLLC